ncbi:accessory Sec system translocase SecA2 [Streptococcus uberis]|uniref:accessory Sec system translocase SecA2 n=1 Tax=Streptococcus uberis TaxID=1349 RepID=UPI0012B66B9C|nr:accessory Sec system translocase SecA2 [Streptococcus uberis]MTB57705.1 accessory Sec system translocase SecA2 [Streptococcus uberis]
MKVKQRNTLFNRMRLKKMTKLLIKINQLADQMRNLTDKELQQQTVRFRERLANGESLDSLLPEAFATIREADYRVLGMFPFDVQVLGGIALHQGRVAEMKTGEGKTLTATLPLYLNGLTGKGAFLVTTNEYLAKRDAQEMGKVYQWMGLSLGVGVYDEKQEVDAATKRGVYASDITYTTATGLGFDYLADNLAASKEGKFLRPFNYVIVDEADAVLLDSAQTPLIISGSPRVQSNFFYPADRFVRTLKEEDEFILDKDDKTVYLTPKGSQYAQSYFDIEDLYAFENYELNRHINLALRAHHLFEKDVDYVVVDNEVKLLDNATGRIMEGIRLQSGIHQAIETKEGVKVTKESRAMATVTYQSLFNMFPKLSGMTGTGKIAESELIETYQLDVVVIPTNTPIQRIDYPDKIYRTLPEKLLATIIYVKEHYQRGQPVLLISGSVAIAEIYSRMLLQEGIPHSVLTAKNVAKEALIIKEAGQKGTVTVATSLAGRGTDIKLGPGVKELGGLAVVGTERMNNGRMDWQLRGRSGRQGDPGTSQFFVSLEDDLIIKNAPKWLSRYFDNHNHSNRKNYGQPIKTRRFYRAIEQAQLASDESGQSAREMTIKFDESMRIQRHKIYELRNSLISGQRNLSNQVETIFNDVIKDYLNQKPRVSEEKMRRYILDNFSYRFRQFPKSLDITKNHQVQAYFSKLFDEEMAEKMKTLKTQERKDEFYRLSVLRAIDVCWIEQVDSLQQLKNLVLLRGVAQRDSLIEYYKESLWSYQNMEDYVKQMIVKNIMLSTVELTEDKKLSIYYV